MKQTPYSAAAWVPLCLAGRMESKPAPAINHPRGEDPCPRI